MDIEEFLQWEKGERQSRGIGGKAFQAEKGARGEGAERRWGNNVTSN